MMYPASAQRVIGMTVVLDGCASGVQTCAPCAVLARPVLATATRESGALPIVRFRHDGATMAQMLRLMVRNEWFCHRTFTAWVKMLITNPARIVAATATASVV